jgi:hypothetical protein
MNCARGGEAFGQIDGSGSDDWSSGKREEATNLVEYVLAGL